MAGYPGIPAIAGERIMPDNLKKNPMNPDLTELLHNLKDDIFRSLNCIKIGRLKTFNQTTKTATIKLLFKRAINDKIISYPVLVDCPVFTLQGGGGSLKMPIAAGDTCLVLFADRNIDNWYSTGSEAAPGNQRCHDISDGIAIVGIDSLVSSLANYDDNVNLTIPATKKLVVSGGATAEILGSAALALLTELNTFIATYNLHTHVETGSTTNVPTQQQASQTGTTKLKGS